MPFHNTLSPLNLNQMLASFDPSQHGGEVMGGAAMGVEAFSVETLGPRTLMPASPLVRRACADAEKLCEGHVETLRAEGQMNG